jgi:hypothetical protein
VSELISLVARPPLILDTPMVKNMYSARFQCSKSRLWLTVICASLSISGTANIPALSQPTNRLNETKQAPATIVLPQSVASKLIQRVARETNIQAGKLRITEVKAKTYDGCLGIYRPDRVCTQIAIQGWQAIVTSPDRTYIYHLSLNAQRIAQNDTASGAKRKINVSFETFGTIAPLAANEVFSSSMSGDLTGRMTRIVLTQDGKITRYQSSPTARFAPVVIKTLPVDRLNAFRKTLENRQFPNFNGLTYLTSAALADYPTTTYQSQAAATQFIDLEKQSLPKSLQQSIASWESLVTPAK